MVPKVPGGCVRFPPQGSTGSGGQTLGISWYGLCVKLMGGTKTRLQYRAGSSGRPRICVNGWGAGFCCWRDEITGMGDMVRFIGAIQAAEVHRSHASSINIHYDKCTAILSKELGCPSFRTSKRSPLVSNQYYQHW
jgi:hypothetical protein